MRRGELKVFLLHHLGQPLVWNGCFLCGSTICWLGVPSVFEVRAGSEVNTSPVFPKGVLASMIEGVAGVGLAGTPSRERGSQQKQASLSRGRVCCLVAGVETLRI